MQRNISNIKIRVVSFRGQHGWIAQALEYDIAAQARTAELARQEFIRVLRARIEISQKMGIQPLSDLPQAPQLFFEMFDQLSRDSRQRKPFNAGGFDIKNNSHKSHVELAFA